MKSVVTEKRVTDVIIQRRPQGSYMVTIPLEIVNDLKLKARERVDVYVDKAKKKVCYKQRQ